MKDIPSHDWFNNLDNYVQTNHDKEAYFDPYVSDYDKETMLNGWFVPSMPDLNQKNPHVAKYLIQNSIWWIEYCGVDGIRQDTYPYADVDMMRNWCTEVMNEYPEYNIVGEAWMNYTIGSAYWQKGSRLNFGQDTELKSVMDFRLMGIAARRSMRRPGIPEACTRSSSICAMIMYIPISITYCVSWRTMIRIVFFPPCLSLSMICTRSSKG